MKEQDESKEALKRRIKIARAEGLLIAARDTFKARYEFNKDGMVKTLDEVLEILKSLE